jgi:hypothetical protein
MPNSFTTTPKEAIMRKAMMTMAAGLLLGVGALTAAEVIWIEGESATKTNLETNVWLKGDNPKLLSGGDTFACLNEKATLPNPSYALWKFNVPVAGLYQVYFRHGYQGHLGQMKFRVIKTDAEGRPLVKPGPADGWIEFDLNSAVMDQIGIGQYRTIEWTRHEPVNLEVGDYILDLQVTGANPNKTQPSDPIWTAIDVICLTSEPFTPRGALKPGESPAAGGGAAPAGGEDYY